jgi:hypothetical protein
VWFAQRDADPIGALGEAARAELDLELGGRDLAPARLAAARADQPATAADVGAEFVLAALAARARVLAPVAV